MIGDIRRLSERLQPHATAAAMFGAEASRAIDERGVFNVALSGGSDAEGRVLDARR